MSSEMTSNRCVLLAVTGMTPQIVTEMLYALKMERNILPDEVHVVTTSAGADCIFRAFFDSENDRWARFRSVLSPNKTILFERSNIHVIRTEEGGVLDDIRTPEDNVLAADFITECVRGFCAQENVRLLVSMAGGRKSMGFYAGYALSLYGRESDGLFHVLVSAPFENHPDFFYPMQADPEYLNVGEQRLPARDARVWLAEIPFVRMRNDPGTVTGGYMAAVREAQEHQVRPASLKLDVVQRTVTASGYAVKLPPLLFAVYLWLSIRVKEGRPNCRPGTDVSATEFLRVYRRVLGGETPDYEHACRALSRNEDFLPYFQEKRALINKRLRACLGVEATPYLIKSFVKRLNTRYGLIVSAESISGCI